MPTAETGGNEQQSSMRSQKKSRKNRVGARTLKISTDEIPSDECDGKCTKCSGEFLVDELHEDGFFSVDWGEAMESQLRQLLLGCLDAVYKGAVKRIEACGYSEEAATKAVHRSELSCKSKGSSSFFCDALSVLRNIHGEDPKASSSFEEMKVQVLEEMIAMLREGQPSISVGDAMWCLLVCDMDMQRAFGLHFDPHLDEMQWPYSTSETEDRSVANSMHMNFSNKLDCKNLEPLAPSLEGVLHSMIGISDLPSRSKSCSNSIKCGGAPSNSNTESLLGQVKKCQGSRSKRESILRQRYFHIEKYQMHGPKGAARTSKFGNMGNLFSEKKSRSFSESAGFNIKSAMMKMGKTARSNISLGEGVSMPIHGGGVHVCPHNKSVSHNEIQFSSSCTTTDMNNDPTKLKYTGPSDISKAFNVARTAGDDMDDKCTPHYTKDEMMIKLSQHIHELQIQLEDWKKWAELKVAQATLRLKKDKAEIQILKQTKDEFGKLSRERETLEQSAMKKFAEMENAISKADDQVAWAFGAKYRLEIENAELRLQMEGSKVLALKAGQSYQEASKREMEIMKKMQSLDRQRPQLQDEVTIEKRKLSKHQEKLNQALKYQHQLEASLRQEEKLKDEVLMHANSIVKEREALETSAKSEEELIRSRMNEHLQKQKHMIENLEEQIDWVRRNTCPLNIVAAPSWGVDGQISALGFVTTYDFSELTGLQESECGYHVPPERECVMCLMEERSVLFLPCAHQMVCVNCNVAHENTGMRDCPSCRALIQRRIPVRFHNFNAGNTWNSGAFFKS